MTAKVNEVRALKTGDYGLVIDANDSFTVLAPGTESKKIVGRYVEKNGVQFALDYATPVSNVALGEVIGHVPNRYPKVGREAPKVFNSLRERWEMLRYIDSPDDVRRVVAAQR